MRLQQNIQIRMKVCKQMFYLRIFTPTEIPMEEIDFQQQEVFINLDIKRNMNGVNLTKCDSKIESANQHNKSQINMNAKQTKKNVKENKMKKMVRTANHLIRTQPTNCIIM